MKHLIIGDIHGIDWFVEQAAENYPNHRLLFLGDLVDSHEESPAKQINCVNYVLGLIHDGRADCLLGNHEMSYFSRELRASGWTAAMEAHLMPLRRRIIEDFLPCMYDPKNRVLFSHAGLSKQLWDHYELSFDNLEETLYEWQNDYRSPFYGIGKSRGGHSKVGGLLWCDYHDEFLPIPGLTQVFGHSQNPSKPRKYLREYKDAHYEEDGGLRSIMCKGIDGLPDCENWNIDCLSRTSDALEYDDELMFFTRKDLVI